MFMSFVLINVFEGNITYYDSNVGASLVEEVLYIFFESALLFDNSCVKISYKFKTFCDIEAFTLINHTMSCMIIWL